MCIETNKEWSELLKSAVIAMNSTRKKSHGYTAFRVMWGRESRYEELLSIDDISSTSAEDFECEETIVDEFPLDEENSGEIEDLFQPSSQQHQEEISIIDENRENTNKSAVKSILTEQSKQKRQYDQKVNNIRYIFKFLQTYTK